MKLNFLTKIAAPLTLLLAASAAQAGSVNLLDSSSPEIQRTVVGVWSNNQRLSFSEAGKYSVVLTDFGGNNFGDKFSYLGAMVSDSYHNLGSVTLNKNSYSPSAFLSFDVTAPGDYWLSLFAITNGTSNTGTFNFNLIQGDTNPVPLPAAFWFMTTSILGLISFARQRRAAKLA